MTEKLPALCVCLNDYNVFGAKITPLVSEGVFCRMTTGNSVEEFAAEKNHADGKDIVLVIGGSASTAVMADLATTGRVKWIHSLWTGVDAYNLPSIKEAIQGIPISNARSAFSEMLAEHVVFSMLYFNRQCSRIQQQRRDKIWNRFSSSPAAGQRLGILGYGDIAKACARMAKEGLRMEVTGLKTRLPKNGDRVDDIGTKLVAGEEGLEQILTESDFVLAVLPRTPQTENMLSMAQFQKMKRSAVFINIGRGHTVVEEDLAAALNGGVIAGAALDVFAVEPLPQESPLWNVDDSKMLLTCHNADIGHDSFTEAGAQFADWARRYVSSNGELPKYLVDIDRGY